MIGLIDDIRHFSLDSYKDILKIKSEINMNLINCKAIVFVISENFLEESISSYDKKEILSWLCCLEMISVIVINCNISDKSIEYLLCFDLCLATAKAKISFKTVEISSEFLSYDQIRLLLSNQYDKCFNKIFDASYLTDFVLVNSWIDSENIECSVKEFITPMLEGKTHDYIRSIKKYFNLYKGSEGIDRLSLQSAETEKFCELALRRFENG